MKLLALELAGFKSFATKVRFSFTDGITAVIGPNGSGKSNVAEAIRWVLGEQSLKQLRGKERTDVIFAGSAGAKQKNTAQVTLTISNDTGRLAIDAAEVAISRSLNRSGESEYQINGDPVRLFDIQHLLADAGLGARSYAVISQGMVDQYLTAKPIDRRELFDEATGIRSHQLKLIRALSKLKQTNTYLAQLKAIVAELQPQLAVLGRQAERHTERQNLQQLFTTAQSDYYQAGWHTLYQQAQAAHAQATAARTEVSRTRQIREAAEAELLDSVRGTMGSTAELLHSRLERAEQDFIRAQNLFEAQERERITLTESLQHAQKSLEQAKQQLRDIEIAIPADTFLTNIGATLANCLQLLIALQDEKPLTQAIVNHLIDQIKITQQLVADEAAGTGKASQRWQHLAGPLQAVARLEAILQERQERLGRLPRATAPDETIINTLRTQLAQKTATEPNHEQQSQDALTKAHDAELAAAQAATVCQVAHEQASYNLAVLEDEIRRERGNKVLTEIQQQPSNINQEVATKALQVVTNRLAAIGVIDPLALQEYEELQIRHANLTAQLTDASATRDNAEQIVESLEILITKQFTSQFQAIRKAFHEHFVLLFGGGSADLTIIEVLPDSLPADEIAPAKTQTGIEIIVHPPGKKPSHLNLLSGGEKALTSLALLLAIVHVQQPPFVVLDEVDAALDEANSYRFTTMLQTLKQHTQCIVITHNRETMDQAETLYGITMQADGISKAYSVQLAAIDHI